VTAGVKHSVLSAPLELYKGEYRFCFFSLTHEQKFKTIFQQLPDLFNGQAGDLPGLYRQQLPCLHNPQSTARCLHWRKCASPAESHMAEFGFCADKWGDDLLLKVICRALTPCSHFQTSDHLAFLTLYFKVAPKLSRNLPFHGRERWGGPWPPGPLPRQAGSSMHTPPGGSQPQDTQAFAELLSQYLLDGGEALTYGPGFSSKIQVHRPSCLLSKAIPPFVLLPPTACSASLSQMNTSQYSSQAAVSSVLPRHKRQRDRAQKGAFLFSSTAALGKNTHRRGLAQSLQ